MEIIATLVATLQAEQTVARYRVRVQDWSRRRTLTFLRVVVLMLTGHKHALQNALNRFFRDVLERQPPPTHGGRAPRIYYVTQAESSPPLFLAWTNAPDSIKDSYKRFVENQIRKAFGLRSVPVTVQYRKRERRD